MLTCLHAYTLHALAYMLARLYAFTCLHTPVLLHAYVLTCLLADGREEGGWLGWAGWAGLLGWLSYDGLAGLA